MINFGQFLSEVINVFEKSLVTRIDHRLVQLRNSHDVYSVDLYVYLYVCGVAQLGLCCMQFGRKLVEKRSFLFSFGLSFPCSFRVMHCFVVHSESCSLGRNVTRSVRRLWGFCASGSRVLMVILGWLFFIDIHCYVLLQTAKMTYTVAFMCHTDFTDFLFVVFAIYTCVTTV